MDQLAVDTNAVVDLLRSDRINPPYLETLTSVFVPLHVLGELLLGAELSGRPDENRPAVEQLQLRWTLLLPDAATAGTYAGIAAREVRAHRTGPKTEGARKNDLWIAALCLQHHLPLLTNDRDFDRIEGLEVIHW